MINLLEEETQRFGYYRTGVHTNNSISINSILNSIKSGSCFVTNGPYIEFTSSTISKKYLAGNTIKSNIAKIHLCTISSPEFGLIENITIIKGVIGDKQEEIHLKINKLNTYNYKLKHNVFIENKCYYRCKVTIASKSIPIFALSNPIWFEPFK